MLSLAKTTQREVAVTLAESVDLGKGQCDLFSPDILDDFTIAARTTGRGRLAGIFRRYFCSMMLPFVSYPSLWTHVAWEDLGTRRHLAVDNARCPIRSICAFKLHSGRVWPGLSP
jgi:hypothetical protein